VAQILVPKRGGKGRVAAQEILIASTGVRAMIREGKTYQIPSAIQTGAKYGMQSIEQALTRMAADGVIDASEPERQLSALGLGREDEADKRLQAMLAAKPAATPSPVTTGATRVVPWERAGVKA
jgi:Tfp pilus assembly ATPase PilU